jgi:hypothetical protein
MTLNCRSRNGRFQVTPPRVDQSDRRAGCPLDVNGPGRCSATSCIAQRPEVNDRFVSVFRHAYWPELARYRSSREPRPWPNPGNRYRHLPCSRGNRTSHSDSEFRIPPILSLKARDVTLGHVFRSVRPRGDPRARREAHTEEMFRHSISKECCDAAPGEASNIRSTAASPTGAHCLTWVRVEGVHCRGSRTLRPIARSAVRFQ